MWTVVKVMMPGKYFVTTINNGNYGVPFTSAKANTCKTLQKTHLQLEKFRNKTNLRPHIAEEPGNNNMM